MKKTVLAIGFALLTLTALAAVAADRGAITINGGNQSVVMNHQAGKITPGKPPKKPLYSNFNTSTSNMYNCCTGWTISEGSTLGYEFTAANPFILKKSATMKSITSALSTVEGNADGYVELVKSCGSGASAEPCKVDYEGKGTICFGKASYTQVFGNCCATVTTKCKAKLKKGKEYWIVMESVGSENNWNVWNWSDASNGAGYDSYSYNDAAWASNGNSYDQGAYSVQ